MKTPSAYLEMLFENRNKEFGAYELRVNYEKRLIRSFLLALSVAGCFLGGLYLLTGFLTAELKPKPLAKLDAIEIIMPPLLPEKPKVIPARPQHFISSNATYRVVEKPAEIKEENQKANEPNDDNESDASALPADSGNSGGSGFTVPDPVPGVPLSAAAVDVMPEFPGGEEALLKFLGNKIVYPEIAKQNKITGRVYVSFVVGESGGIESIQIVRGLGYGTEDEVVRVIGIMPKWSPGMYHGRPVKTAFVMPVLFKLK